MTAPDTPRAAFRPACIYRSGCQNPQICLEQDRCGGESRGRAEAEKLPEAGDEITVPVSEWDRLLQAEARAQAAEERATKAEERAEARSSEADELAAQCDRLMAERDALAGALRAVLTWAEQRCPCENEEPNPCPLCGASVENLEGCKSAENTMPRDLLRKVRAALATRTEHAKREGSL